VSEPSSIQNTKSLIKILHSYFPFGIHLSRKTWDWLEVSTLYGQAEVSKVTSGMYGIRLLTDRFNERRQHSSLPLESLQAGQTFTVSVIVDILRYLVTVYCHDQIPGVIPKGHDWAKQQRGEALVEKPPATFVGFFPPVDVYEENIKEKDFLRGKSDWATNRETVSSEMILLALAMENPAFKRFRVLFDDVDLKRETPYLPFVGAMEEYFRQQPPFAPLGIPLFECLRAPMREAPDSLEGQLAYIRQHWAAFLPPELLEKLLLAADILKEDWHLRSLDTGSTEVLQFGRRGFGYDQSYSEPSAFTTDADWMSNVVLLAKLAYVWLDQMSKKYRRHIKLLSDVPDEELDQLARWGFTGLWLIGVWERSQASQNIKQIMGNPEAAPSAYSLYDYVIAADLGGEEAYQNLRERAWKRGIRLASDMVPNHMGIYSRWVVEHPNWFVQLDYPPFPVYQFTGVDLSLDPRVCIQIEDGYWQHRDAAVVFKRIDKWTGGVKYIYHGNDGTSMPWNDTAQLNFLIPEVREAVIQLILHVARKFPIIRFDAAMTLAKRHYHRLWFPQHGDGGAIPSRAEYGMSKEQFDQVFPKEFWREVVDRVQAEVPDTLLLAEAFWLMEGYFVRTLGMHRVYNSAFMNMLKMEDNSKYRMTVKNVLKFSPEVAKRFVNFMNNPDERTAIEQFGKGDKYYGAAMMLVTMPGLPMFGHGQIEGFTEKYGMEYRKAYWDEQVDDEMVRRHEREIFPLMRRRKLFSGAENFALYDFHSPEGWVDENVFAYSNRAGGERAIILYNNAYSTARGTIHTSTQINAGTGEEEYLVTRTLAEALALDARERVYYIFRDYRTGLEYIRAGKQIGDEGLFAELHAYQYMAFLDWREVYDHDGSWWNLAGKLQGGGVLSIEDAHREMALEPLLTPFREAINAEMLYNLPTDDSEPRKKFHQAMARYLASAQDYAGAESGYEDVLLDIMNEVNVVPVDERLDDRDMGQGLLDEVLSECGGTQTRPLHHVAIGWITVHRLGHLRAKGEASPATALAEKRLDDWLLGKSLMSAFREFSGSESLGYADALLVSIMVTFEDTLAPFSKMTIAQGMKEVLVDPRVVEYLQIHRHEDVLYLNKEQLERLVSALLLAVIIQLKAKSKLNDTTAATALQMARQILSAAEAAGYRVEVMLRGLGE